MNINELMIKDPAKGLNEQGKLANMGADIREREKQPLSPSAVGEEKPAQYRRGYQIKADQFYDRKSLRKTAAEAYEKQKQTGMDVRSEKEEMLMAAQSMSGEDYRKMQQEGFDPRHTKSKEFVTIADKIRMQLAKAGADVSITGGIKSDAIEAMTGSEAEAAGVEKKLDEEAKAVFQKADQLPEELPKEAIRYLIANEMEPTAANVFTAVYAGATTGQEAKISEEDFAALRPQVEATIEKASLPVNQNQIDQARWLLDQSLPLTEDNLLKLNAMQEKSLRTGYEEVLQAITDAVKEGKTPQDAMLLPGISMMDQAREAMDVIAGSTPEMADRAAALTKDGQITIQALRQAKENPTPAKEDITARRQLEEVRLMMTTEANATLIRKGMKIDMAPLMGVVEALKAQEADIAAAVFGEDTPSAELYEKTTEAMQTLKSAPAALLSSYKTIDAFSNAKVETLAVDGQKLAAKLAAAGERYETMGTEVRKDLGDSIRKAFRNVDDILTDLGLETSASNERAVRILGYNSREITEEAIAKVKAADEQVTRVFKGMTPATVLELIRRGENPLELSMKELEEKTRSVAQERLSVQSQGKGGNNTGDTGKGDAQKDAQDFAEFLWKAEQTKAISEEERESFIGLYRLMHQVDQTDGAAIGKLLYQGAEVTLKNLMGAVTTAKHEGRTYEVSDEQGATEAVFSSLSVTQQARVAFETGRIRDAKEIVTPSGLKAIGGENAYLPMTPDQLATALEAAETDASVEDALLEENVRQVREAVVQADENDMTILRDAGVADTPENMAAIHQILADRRNLFTRVFGSEGRKTFAGLGEDLFSGLDSLDTVIDQLVEDFKEKCKTPEDMAKAQEKLAETAENVLRKALADDAAKGSIDIRGIQQSVRQVQIMKELSEKKETYAVPVMVADKLGNLTLKIVRGKEEEKGLVDIAFDSAETGAVCAQFKTDGDGGIIGRIKLSQAAVRQAVSEQLPQMAARIQEVLGGGSVSLLAEYDGRTDPNAVFRETLADFEVTEDRSNPVQTKTLYGVARGFIESLSEMF
ncbi:hypothetical protein SAMN05216391_11049 [Lachnospiraceae bacterium KHCPX20]|nr:hypothetical protein SAMN05216391_11049 [Lachnospiraceae bacterium KHCPX20]